MLTNSAISRQLSIFTTGFGDRSEEVLAQAQFFADRLSINVSTPLTVMIMSSQLLPAHLSGVMEHGEDETLGVSNVMIKLNAQLSATDLTRVLAHEMVHAAQYAKGNLVKVNGMMFRWKGQMIVDINHIPYRQRKWEKEAFAMERDLVKAYENSLKG